jgi:uncharacterized protein (DUF697 family)
MDDKPQQKTTPTSEVEVIQPTDSLATSPVDKPSFLESFGKTIGEVGEAITYSGKAIVVTAVGVGEVFGSKALEAGKAVVESATEIGETAAKQTHQLISQATQGAGQAITHVSDNWLVRRVSGVLNLDWLIGASDRVDLEKAASTVQKLHLEHPNESPSQIAHRIMVDKAIYAGGLGFVTSLVPGEAIALLAVDLATTTLIQAEMVYQIAAAYGLDLKEPARKGEVLAIFGLAFGGSRAIKVGLGLLRTVPVAGAVIGASANATMLYSLGYAACRFYEAKLNSATIETAKLAVVKEASENYLETAIAQVAVMDQILVHMVLASHPEKSWSEIIPDLQALNLSPTSLEAIASNIKSPQPIDTLLEQLNRDFAVPLLAQCYRIAHLDGDTTLLEEHVMTAIATKFDIDLNSIESAVQSDRESRDR